VRGIKKSIWIVWICFFGVVCQLFSLEAYTAVSDKGTVGTNYTVFFPHPEAYLSRDGSLAKEIQSPIQIEKPGTYFLWLVDGKGSGRSIRFTVLPKENTNYFNVKNEEALEEIFRDIFSEFKEEVVLDFQYGTFSVQQLNSLCLSYADQVLIKYPILTFDSFELTSTGGEEPVIKLKIQYPLKQKNDLIQLKRQTEDEILNILQAKIQRGMKIIDREKVLYTYIATHVKYAEDKNTMSYTLQGAIIEGVSVCDGYAKSIQYLFNAVGIPTYYVRGSAEKEAHAWNIAKLKEGYYHVDATWGAQGPLYQYFNLTDEYVQKTHSWQRNLYPKSEGPLLTY
jgi:transglutaminase-like putative cysteine protease